MSVDVSKFPPLSVTGIGLVDGLLGANCRHSIGPGDGVHNPFEQFDSEENRKREQLDQRQRLLERRIRGSRREVMGLQEAVEKAPDADTRAELEAAYRKKAAKLQRQEAEYDTFCKKNDLRKLYDRLAVARYGPEQAKAAERAAGAGVLKNTAGKRIISIKRTQLTAKPNSITQRAGPHGGIDRNFYGPDGRQTLQISNYGHGHKREEAMGEHGEHAHDYTWDADGNWTRSEARELHDDERRDNGDFL